MEHKKPIPFVPDGQTIINGNRRWIIVDGWIIYKDNSYEPGDWYEKGKLMLKRKTDSFGNVRFPMVRRQFI